MACETTSSPLPDGIFDDSWVKTEGSNGGLDAIVDFNASFGQQDDTPVTIDPSLTFSDPTTPQKFNQDAFNLNATTAGLDQTFSPAASYEAYPASFDEIPASPYFQSIELNSQPIYHPSPLRNERFSHRRSVSEPPGMADVPQPMFHREQHFLGPPMRQKGMHMKSLPKNKTSREYSPATRKSARSNPYPYPAAEHQTYRPGVHRSQTQPVRSMHPPTSMPMNMNVPQYFHPAHPGSKPRPGMSVEQQYGHASTSRVCTPIPEAITASPIPIDPALTAPGIPTATEKKQARTVTIQVSREELKTMIFEAVQQAMDGKERPVSLEVGNDDAVSPKAVQMDEVQVVDTAHSLKKVQA